MGLRHSSEKAMKTCVTQKDSKANTAWIFKDPIAIKITSNSMQALSFMTKSYRTVLSEDGVSIITNVP